jgi:hypothetical protein
MEQESQPWRKQITIKRNLDFICQRQEAITIKKEMGTPEEGVDLHLTSYHFLLFSREKTGEKLD